MSRRRRITKRELLPDPVYRSRLMTRFVNKVMICGKKSLAQRIVYGAVEKFAKKVGVDSPLSAFDQALDNAKPLVEVKSRRVGGATFQVPVEIPAERRVSMGMKWIITHARKKKGMDMESALASELMDCFQHRGATIKKKEDTHRMADSNRAYAHFKW